MASIDVNVSPDAIGSKLLKSDFSNSNPSNAFNFKSSSTDSNIVDGANALKIDTDANHDENLDTLSAQTLESLSTQQTSEESFPQTQEVVLENKEMENDKLLLKDEYEEEAKVSNGLENFKLDEETPELFNLENETETAGEDQSFISFNEEKNSDEDEDELAIPAFLRRQKN